MEIRLCDSKTAYQVLPDRQMKLNLFRLRDRLERMGVLLAVTPYVAVMKTRDGVEFSLYSSGKVLFRNFLDREKSARIASEVYGLVGK